MNNILELQDMEAVDVNETDAPISLYSLFAC